MKRWQIWVVSASVLLVAIPIAGWLWLRASLPQLDGAIALPGLAAPVTVARDTVGVPHILARSATDAAFALGFVHAQDRLWQMEFNRRLGAGRLAEVLGEKALSYDRTMRTYGFYRLAEQDFLTFDAPTRARYEAYAAGVNAYLANRSGPLPPEFLLLGVKPQPWRPADSLVWLKLMALDMAYGWRRELDRLQLAGALTPEQTAQLLDNTTDPLVVPPDIKALLGELPRSAFVPPAAAEGSGSNNWVIAGNRSRSGKPLLANDPHIGFSQPGIWYLAHVGIGSRNIVGVTFPGLPFVVLGRNDTLAWGFTNVAPDVHDLIVERIDPSAGTYVTPTGPAPVAARIEVISVKGEDDVRLKVRETRNGPLISDVIPGLARALGPTHALALRWTMLQPGDRTGVAGLKVNDARSADDLLAALRDFAGPMQNLVYAHVDGTVGYITPGRLPRRAAAYPGRGLIPAPGWLAQTRWDAMTPFDELVQLRNPADGYVVTANNRITDRPYPDHVTYEWEGSFRHDRIVDLVKRTPKHSLATMRSIQSDILDPALGEAARRLAALASDKPMAQGLIAWNGVMRADEREPLLAWAWVQAFSKRISRDELGPRAEERLSDYNIALVLRVLRGMGTAPRWCDDIATGGPPETCARMAALALDDALASLEASHGANREAWRWGARHRVAFEHRPFSQVPLLKRFFARSIEVAGGPDSINVAHSRARGVEAGAVYLGPSLRALYDLADLEQSRFMIPTGQSGNPLSPWYDNLSEPWSRMQDFRIPTDRKLLATRMAHQLRLEPERAQ